MSRDKSSSPAVTASTIFSPTRRAVHYLRGTWRRVIGAPKVAHRRLLISSPIQVTRRSGVCIDRTQLNDVVDDDELTIVPSHISRRASMLSSGSSPVIRDSDWRHFNDTPMESSPSYFLGAWSKCIDPSSQHVRLRSSSDLTTRFSIIGSIDSEDNSPTGCESHDALSSCSTPPPTSAGEQPKKTTFLRYRERPQCSSESSSDVSVVTPTPAFRQSSRSLRRRISKSIMGPTAVGDLEKQTREFSAEEGANLRPQADSPDISDRWSFVSVRGEPSTNDILQCDTSKLPTGKRYKFSRPEGPSRDERRELQHSTVRSHPRYSGTFALEPNRRVVHTFHGPAVLIPPLTKLRTRMS
jgi:hypothetical protein